MVPQTLLKTSSKSGRKWTVSTSLKKTRALPVLFKNTEDKAKDLPSGV